MLQSSVSERSVLRFLDSPLRLAVVGQFELCVKGMAFALIGGRDNLSVLEQFLEVRDRAVADTDLKTEIRNRSRI